MQTFVLCFEDVFSYDEDDMVEDPKLAQHLAHFGINMMIMEKVIECEMTEMVSGGRYGNPAAALSCSILSMYNTH